MAIFGRKKDNDNDNKNDVSEQNNIDAMILAAIEETDEEEQQRKEEARKAHAEKLEADRIAHEKEEAFRKAMAELPNGGRRFYLMVEETAAEEGNIKVTGNLHGETHVGDIIYVYLPGGRVIETSLLSVGSASGEKMADQAKNLRVTMTLPVDLADNEDTPEKVIPKYSVVSGVKRSDGKPGGAPVDNPALVGTTLEFKDLHDDKEYMGTLFGHISAAKFLVPINPDAGGQTPDGRKKVGFLLLKDSKAPDGPASVPVFTDPAAMAQWKEIYEGGKKPSVILANLAELTKITAQNGPDIIINPFGPVPVKMPRKMAVSLCDAHAKLARDTMKRRQQDKNKLASRIFINEPDPSDETEAVRSALKKSASGISGVSSLGLLNKVQGGRKSYLVVVDCPKEAAPDIFRKLYEAVKPELSSIKSVDFILYAEAAFADDYFGTHSFDYIRIGNL